MPDNIDCLILVLELRLHARRHGDGRLLTALADAIEAHAQDLAACPTEAA